MLQSLSKKIRKFPKHLIDGIQQKFPRLQRTPKTAEQRKEQVWGALRANSKLGLCHTPYHTTYHIPHTIYHIPHTTYHIPHTTHYTLHTKRYTILTTHYILQTTHHILHITQYTLHTTH